MILQRYTDEFDLPPTSRSTNTPALVELVLSTEMKEEELVNKKTYSSYRTGVSKLLHITRWSRLETWNTVRELARAIKGPIMIHYNTMIRVIRYCVNTSKREWRLHRRERGMVVQIRVSNKQDVGWRPATRRSVSGYNVKLEGVVIIYKSGMQKTTTLWVTEAVTVSGVSCA